MKKRIVAMLLVLIMMLSTVTALAEKDEKFTVTYLCCWSGYGAKFPDDMAGNPCGKFISDKFGIELVGSDCGSQSEVEYLNMLFSADMVPDLVDAPYWGSQIGGEGYVVINGAIEGMVKNIAPYLDQFPNLAALYGDTISPVAKKDLFFNEEYPEEGVYFIPVGNDMQDEMTRDVFGNTVYARADILEAVGVKAEDVKTMDDMFELMMKIKAANLTDFNGNPIIPMGTSHDGWRQQNIYFWLNGNNISDWRLMEDGSVAHYLFTDYVEERVAYMRKLLENELMDVECFTQSTELANSKIAQGKYALLPVQANSVASYYGDQMETRPETKWVPLNLTNKDGNSCVDVYTPGWTSCEILFFREGIEEDKLLAILSMLDWFCTDEGITFLNYGVEGETFEYVDGKPQMLPEVAAKIEEDSWAPYKLYGLKLFEFGKIVNKDLWKITREEMTPKDQYYQEIMDNFRPRAIVTDMSVDELLKEWDGYEDLMDNLTTLDIETQLNRAYFMETDEEAKDLIEELRAKAIAFGIEDAAKYIHDHLEEGYAF